MWRLRRKARRLEDGELFAEIDRLAASNRDDPNREVERRLLLLRHRAGIRVAGGNGTRPEHPSPAFDQLPNGGSGLPELSPTDLTPELLRAGILRDGCVLVRGLVDRDEALRFAAEIDRSFGERDRHDSGQTSAEGYYEEFSSEFAAGAEDVRPWVKQGGGVLAVDTPMLTAEMLRMFEAAGLQRLVESYLGERPLISVQKTTLRKAEPHVGGAWHQDGKFMGDVRALNLWLALSRCGDESPGLDIVPRRLDYIVTTTTDEALLGYQVSQSKVEEAAGDTAIVRPVFEPGDALLFDELFLHQTGSDPSMPNPRFAIESWFFGASGFPPEYGPIAV